MNQTNTQLIDPLGRHITYLRLSITDRCDFRCRYCMSEKMVFLPKKDVLSLEELYRIAKTFIECGINKIRLTGGEPLVRKDIQSLVRLLGQHTKDGLLDELTLSTNGSQLATHSKALVESGIKRINVSMDTLNPDKFTEITRRGDLKKVIAGILSAKAEGIDVKINAVLMKGVNDQEIPELFDWCENHGCDLTLIETMPMADTGEDRIDRYLPLQTVIDSLIESKDLIKSNHHTSGPARYYETQGGNIRLGVITPLSNNFCDGCNRIRLTCTGQLYLCLGQDNHVDFRQAIRNGASDDDLKVLLKEAISIKPARHDFEISGDRVHSSTLRHMNTTGG